MTETDVVYSDVKFSKVKENAEVFQGEVPHGRSKVTERLPLLVICALLAAAVIGLGCVTLDYLKTMKKLQTLKDENEALRKNLTEKLSETTVQPMCLKPTETCEEGWEQHGGTCYYFSTSASSWSQSRDDCKCRGGDLVKIDSTEEQLFLKKKTREEMKEDEDKFWIGLTDSKTEGKWLWVDDSPLNTSLLFWSGAEPDNWTGEDHDGEDCARMGEAVGAEDLKCWFDKSCTAAQLSICEKPAETGH